MQPDDNTLKMASFRPRADRNVLHHDEAGQTDATQVDAPPEDNTEKELYEVDIDSDSFDLEEYNKNYCGLVRIFRLMYIADHCPKLRSDALRLAISHVIETMNVNLYQMLHQKLRLSQDPMDLALPANYDDWAKLTTQKAAIKLEKLEGDLRNYKKNSIKESIRRGYSEMGDHYINCGYLVEASKCYLNARKYCTTPVHEISLYLNTIKVAIYLKNWSSAVDFINKARSIPDYTENTNYQITYSCSLQLMTGLAELAQRKYKLAAENFLHANLNYWDSNNVMTPNDVAIYGSLCALASLSRAEFRENVICNNTFKLFLELEPEMRDALIKFHETKYDICLTILNRRKAIFLLDMNIGPHINQLYSDIRIKAMKEYFFPYDSADLRKMALCFNTTVPDLVNELEQLILDGHIKARIDLVNEILYAKHPNRKIETFEKIMSLAQQYSRYMHILIIKSQMMKRLKQNAIISQRKCQS